jgi:hypothetical protein
MSKTLNQERRLNELRRARRRASPPPLEPSRPAPPENREPQQTLPDAPDAPQPDREVEQRRTQQEAILQSTMATSPPGAPLRARLRWAAGLTGLAAMAWLLPDANRGRSILARWQPPQLRAGPTAQRTMLSLAMAAPEPPTQDTAPDMKALSAPPSAPADAPTAAAAPALAAAETPEGTGPAASMPEETLRVYLLMEAAIKKAAEAIPEAAPAPSNSR